MYHIWNIQEHQIGEMVAVQDNVRKSLVRQYAYVRKMKGLTQAEVARRAGISRTNVSRFESGEYNPTLEMLVKLANAMDLEVSITLSQKKMDRNLER